MPKPDMSNVLSTLPPSTCAVPGEGKKAWCCPQCKTTDESLAYRSGKMKKCRDCQRYHNLLANSAKTRKHGHTPDVEITHTQFLAWARSGPRCCHYCRIDEEKLVLLEQKSSIGRTVEALGIDRLDNAANYSAQNIAWCCYACNKVKSNVFSEEEMQAIGRVIGQTWQARLLRLGLAS